MKTKHIILLVVFVLLGIAAASAQEKRMVVNYHNSKTQYLVDEVNEVIFEQQLTTPAAIHCAVQETSIVVSWTASRGATEYIVERCSIGSDFKVIGTSDTNSFIDQTPQLGMNFYRVTATGEIKSSSPSKHSEGVYFVPTDLAATGMYMGIIGFNNTTIIQDVQILSPSTLNSFTSFVNRLTTDKGTLLYRSVDDAIEMLSTQSLPADLSSVSIVTFTDGLDQGSMMKAGSFSEQSDYLAEIRSRLASTKINGKSIEAFAIGLRGTDVKDVNAFRKNLQSLVSAPENVAEITNLAQLDAKFTEIASRLSETIERQIIRLQVSGNPGTKMRFTFDKIPTGSDASVSNLYIEGTYNRRIQDGQPHYWLEDVSYHGLTCSAGDKLEGEMATTQDGIVFTFPDVMVNDGSKLSIDTYQRWRYIPSLSFWQPDGEGAEGIKPDSETIYKSGAVILVLDCSTSLGTQFSTVKSQAVEFVKKMAKNTINTDEQQWNVMGMGKFVDGFIPSIRGDIPQIEDVIIQQSSKNLFKFRLVRPYQRYGSAENWEIDATNQSNVISNMVSTGVEFEVGQDPASIGFRNVEMNDGIFKFKNNSLLLKTGGQTYMYGAQYGTQLLLPDVDYQPLTMSVSGDKAAFTLATGTQKHLYRIDWGDGESSTFISDEGEVTHKYNKSGNYNITILGPEFSILKAPGMNLTYITIPYLDTLTELDLSNNILTSIKISGASHLQRLNVSNNNLSQLDVTGCGSIGYLDCSHNNLNAISGIDKLAKLTELNSSSNTLETLSIVNLTDIVKIDISNNSLSVDMLPKSNKMTYLDISNNLFTDFDLTERTGLEIFNCKGNPGAYGKFYVQYLQGVFSVPDGFYNKPWGFQGASVMPQYGVQISYTAIRTNRQEVKIQLDGYTPIYIDWGDGEVTKVSYQVNSHSYEETGEHKIVIAGYLTKLDCGNNGINYLDVSNQTELTELLCTSNNIVKLDIKGLTNINNFDCSNNLIKKLDLQNNKKLTSVDASACPINEIVFPESGTIKELYLEDFNLEILDISTLSELQTLVCRRGCIKELITSEALQHLTFLDCVNNQIKNLPLAIMPSLTSLRIGHNNITSLDLSHVAGLNALECENNRLEELDIESNTALTTLNVSGNPGVNGVFRVYSWFSAPELQTKYPNMTSSTWEISGETITPKYGPRYGKMKFTATSSSVSINCENAVAAEFSVDWGDGSIEKLTTHETKQTIVKPGTSVTTTPNYFTHTYADNGIHVVTISGNIEKFYCDAKATTLEVSGNPHLQQLNCNGNQLTTLNLEASENLKTLYCNNNKLQSIIFAPNINTVEIRNNNFTSLTVDNASIVNLQCYENSNMTSLTVTSKCTSLRTINAQKCNLSYVSINTPSLVTLVLKNNSMLSYLNLSALTSLSSLDISNCSFSSLDISNNRKLTSFTCTGNKNMTVKAWFTNSNIPSGFTRTTWTLGSSPRTYSVTYTL